VCSRRCSLLSPSSWPSRLRCSSCTSSCTEGARGCSQACTAVASEAEPTAVHAARASGTRYPPPRQKNKPGSEKVSKGVGQRGRAWRTINSLLGSPPSSITSRFSASPSPSQNSASCLESAGGENRTAYRFVRRVTQTVRTRQALGQAGCTQRMSQGRQLDGGAPVALAWAAPRVPLAPRCELMQRRWLTVDTYCLRQRGHLTNVGGRGSAAAAAAPAGGSREYE
jgi:hypothetical protein